MNIIHVIVASCLIASVAGCGNGYRRGPSAYDGVQMDGAWSQHSPQGDTVAPPEMGKPATDVEEDDS